jgi:hypothetical protein
MRTIYETRKASTNNESILPKVTKQDAKTIAAVTGAVSVGAFATSFAATLGKIAAVAFYINS